MARRITHRVMADRLLERHGFDNREMTEALTEVIKAGNDGLTNARIADTLLPVEAELVYTSGDYIRFRRDISVPLLFAVLSDSIADAIADTESRVMFKSTRAFGLTRNDFVWPTSGTVTTPQDAIIEGNKTALPKQEGDGLCESFDPIKAIYFGDPHNLLAIKVKKADILGGDPSKARFSEAQVIDVLDFNDALQLMANYSCAQGIVGKWNITNGGFSHPYFRMFWLIDGNVRSTYFHGGRVHSSEFDGCFFSECEFVKVDFRDTTFRDCVFVDCDLRACQFAETSFVRCKFLQGPRRGYVVHSKSGEPTFRECRVNGERLG